MQQDGTCLIGLGSASALGDDGPAPLHEDATPAAAGARRRRPRRVGRRLGPGTPLTAPAEGAGPVGGPSRRDLSVARNKSNASAARSKVHH